jgi:hypothetical protein
MSLVWLVVLYVIGTAVSVLVFAASLFLVEDLNESSFREAPGPTWAKCALLVIALTLLGLLPFGQLIGLVVFFVGTMALFRKTFLQALVLLVVNGLFSVGVAWLIGKLVVWLL